MLIKLGKRGLFAKIHGNHSWNQDLDTNRWGF